MTHPIDRGALRAELADHVRQLTEHRDSFEYFEQEIRTPGRPTKRTRRRRSHHVTLPPLLGALADALVPAAGGTGPTAAAGFESRPAAELEPAAVLRGIRDTAARWAHHLGLDPATPDATLRALADADLTDDQLAQLVAEIAYWIGRGKIAAGENAPERVIADPCPYCFRRNALAIAGNLEDARCTRCGTRWTVDTIGLLAQMLRDNQELEVLADVAERCWMADCTERGTHDRHQDGRGRTWGDRCQISMRECSR